MNSPEWFIDYNPILLQVICDSILEHIPLEPIQQGLEEPQGLREGKISDNI